MSEKEITDAYMKRHAFTDQLYARQKVTTTSNKRIIKTKKGSTKCKEAKPTARRVDVKIN